MVGEVNKIIDLNRKASTAWARHKRVFVGPKVDEEKIRQMFLLSEEELYVAMDENWGKGLNLPYDLGSHMYVFFLNNFADLKEKLDEAGWQEWEDYIDGKSLIMPHPSRIHDAWLC